MNLHEFSLTHIPVSWVIYFDRVGTTIISIISLNQTLW